MLVLHSSYKNKAMNIRAGLECGGRRYSRRRKLTADAKGCDGSNKLLRMDLTDRVDSVVTTKLV